MTKLEDAAVEAVFNKADGFVQTIDKALEELENNVGRFILIKNKGWLSCGLLFPIQLFSHPTLKVILCPTY